MRLDMSTAYHPQTYGQSERTIQTLEDMSLVLWAEIGEGSFDWTRICKETTNKVVVIKEKLQATRDRQTSYADSGRKITDYEVGENVLLKVSVWGNANLHVPLNEIKINKTLRFVEEPIEIMDREVKSLKHSRIPLVKVRWNSKRSPEFTREREDYMKSKYPQLFVDRAVEPTS
ncbi:putative reverse transcriptase domain-containing protein [Tanacetum coccineum]